MKRYTSLLALCLSVALCAFVSGCANGPFTDDYTVTSLAKEDARLPGLFAELRRVCEESGLIARQAGFPSLWYFRSFDPKNADDRAGYLHFLCDFDRGRLQISIRSNCPDCLANAKFRADIEQAVRSVFPNEQLKEQHAKMIIIFSYLQKKADPCI